MLKRIGTRLYLQDLMDSPVIEDLAAILGSRTQSCSPVSHRPTVKLAAVLVPVKSTSHNQPSSLPSPSQFSHRTMPNKPAGVSCNVYSSGSLQGFNLCDLPVIQGAAAEPSERLGLNLSELEDMLPIKDFFRGNLLSRQRPQSWRCCVCFSLSAEFADASLLREVLQ